MNIKARIPGDRMGEGQLFLEDALLGRCRGKADNQAAATHGNPHRSPVRPFGDHPGGTYRVTEVREVGPDGAHSYGPFKLVLDPIDGEALLAKQNGRTDLEMHGGDLATDGVSLRPTFGCLRTTNAIIKVLAAAVRQALARGEEVLYTCEIA